MSHEEGKKGEDVLWSICKTTTEDGVRALASTNHFLSLFHREFGYQFDDIETSLQNFRSLKDTIGSDGKKRGAEGVWKDIVEKEETGTYVFVLNLLLKCELVRNAFPPAYTEAGSSHDRRVAAIESCNELRSEAPPWVFHYGVLCDPRNPRAAIEGLIERWPDLLNAPVGHHILGHNGDGEGGSKAGSRVSSVATDSPEARAKRKNSGDGQEEVDGCESNTGKKQKN